MTHLVASKYRGFSDGQKVTHCRWRDPAGRPLTGTVRVFDLSPADRAEGCGEAEVRWHGTFVADELDLVINDIT